MVVYILFIYIYIYIYKYKYKYGGGGPPGPKNASPADSICGLWFIYASSKWLQFLFSFPLQHS